MSLSRLFLPLVIWTEFAEVLSYLTLAEVQHSLSGVSRSGYLTHLREKQSRQCPVAKLGKATFLKRSAWALALWKRGQQPERLDLPSCLDKILLVSYPRSGNSFLRHLLEERTGVITGSDSRSNRTLSASLLRCGFRGEGVADSSVWVVKSHFPERMGYLRFRANRVVLLVRNPFDSIESYFHMGLTNTHDKMLTQEVMQSEALQALWGDFVRNEAAVWTAFHQYWLLKSMHVPVLFVRFEDLLLDERTTMREILHFMQSEGPESSVAYVSAGTQSSLSASKNEFNGIVGVSREEGPGYSPKATTRRIGKSLAAMTGMQQREVTATTGFYMDLFGYQCVSEPDGGAKEASRLNVLPLEMSKIARASASFPHPPPRESSTSEGDGVQRRSYDLKWRLNAGPLSGAGGLIINEPVSIRTADDRFGRGMTDIRKGMTVNDTRPLKTC